MNKECFTLAVRVKQLREYNRLSQKELADKAGLKQSQISAIENSTRSGYSLNTIQKLSTALGVSVGHLLDDGNPLVMVSRKETLNIMIRNTCEKLQEEDLAALLPLAQALARKYD